MIKVGLYFGSFNPIHHGHLIIANHLLYQEDLDQIWFVVSPQNPFKAEQYLLNEFHRLHLTKLATDGVPGFRVCDIEFQLPRPSYTIDTLQALDDKYPSHEFCIIMGSDSYMNIGKWKKADKLCRERKIYVYIRKGFPVESDVSGNIVLCKAPLLDISASMIRKIWQEGHSIRYYVPESVREEIEKGNYYRRG